MRLQLAAICVIGAFIVSGVPLPSAAAVATWSKIYPGSLSGGIYGTFDGGYIFTSIYGHNLWVAKVDATGAIQWQEQIGTSQSSVGPYVGYHSIVQLVCVTKPNCGYTLVGSLTNYTGVEGGITYGLLVTLDYRGNMLRKMELGTLTDQWQPLGVVATPDGGVAVVGESGNTNMFVAKFSAVDKIQWVRWINRYADVLAASVARAPDGGYIVGAMDNTASTYTDWWLIKLSSSGVIQWQSAYGTVGLDLLYTVKPVKGGGYIAVGSSVQSSYPYLDSTWVVRFNSVGNVVWQESFGGGAPGRLVQFGDVVQTADGGFVLAGDVVSYGHGSWDGWLIKVSSNGATLWQNVYGWSGTDAFTGILSTRDGGLMVMGFTNSFGGWATWLVKTDSLGIPGSCPFVSPTSATPTPLSASRILISYNATTYPRTTYAFNNVQASPTSVVPTALC